MLSIAQFRAVLTHEFGHYYAGDTRLGHWVYNTRRAIEEVYKNLGRKSDILTFLRPLTIVGQRELQRKAFAKAPAIARDHWLIPSYVARRSSIPHLQKASEWYRAVMDVDRLKRVVAFTGEELNVSSDWWTLPQQARSPSKSGCLAASSEASERRSCYLKSHPCHCARICRKRRDNPARSCST
jgi:hypothetical protein